MGGGTRAALLGLRVFLLAAAAAGGVARAPPGGLHPGGESGCHFLILALSLVAAREAASSLRRQSRFLAAKRKSQKPPGALGVKWFKGWHQLLDMLFSCLPRGPVSWGPGADNCLLPYVVGRCRAAFPRWWYNATSQACQEFTFGGCGGNSNNFLSKKECFRTCVTGGEEKTMGTPVTSPDGAERHTTEAVPTSRRRNQQAKDMGSFQEYCAVPRATGRCRAAFPRWFFDIETRTCKMFVYGGCGGNKNNYLQEEDCLSQCAAGSELPGEPGEDPKTHPHLFPDSAFHSTRAVVLAVLLALLLAALVLVLVKICRRSRELSLSTVWSTMDDKELLMSSGYSL
uniref:putative Kunitz-type serine protease inhibitor n=1 Tax=Euleptes europaea TaxID=460621 RepID=UPI00253FEA8E|nr:putative Kunitz-type serine protease inhibitor [Euleptes europaea]